MTSDPREEAAPLTIGALIDRLAAESPEREALVHPHLGLRWSAAELSARADALARGLIALGLAPGEHLALWAGNRPEWVPLQLAAARAGLVLVTANAALVEDEIGFLLRQSRARAVIAAPGIQAREGYDALVALERRGATPELRDRIALEAPAPAGFLTQDALVERGAQVPISAVRARTSAVEPDEAACVLYTSGTTGLPKGVVLTHASVVGNARAVARRMELTEHDRVLLAVPLFHCFGCVIAVLGALTHGAALVQLPRFDPLRALEAIERERCSVLHGVPSMYVALCEHEERARFDLGSLRAGAMGGAPCPPELLARVAQELGCAGIANAYGLTECAPAVCISAPSDPPERRFTTAGLPVDGVRVRVRDVVTEAVVPFGEQGEVQVQGPYVMRGYFECPEDTRAAFTADGWLRTGDLGSIEHDGRLRITGRIKDLILRGGENVMPAEIENALRAHFAVRDVAVFGVPHPRLGEEVRAAVILRGGCVVDEEELLRSLEGRIAVFKRPARVHFVDGFPMTASGKVKKGELREWFG